MIAIGSSERVEELRDRLLTEFQTLRSEGLEIQIRTISKGSWTFLGCDMPGRKLTPPDTGRRLRLYIANAVSDLIINHWEERFVRRLIRNRYGYMDDSEQETIYSYAFNHLYIHNGKDQTHNRRIKRKGAVLARLAEFLDKHNELIIDGFITFRLKDYVEELEEAVEAAVEEFLIQKEEREFLQLLKCFVNMQEAQVEFLNIWPDSNGSFCFTDGSHKPVHNNDFDGLIQELSGQGISHDDLLVSALVALSPGQIKFHCHDRVANEVIGLLKDVFGARMTLCNDCSQCRSKVPCE